MTSSQSSWRILLFGLLLLLSVKSIFRSTTLLRGVLLSPLTTTTTMVLQSPISGVVGSHSSSYDIPFLDPSPTIKRKVDSSSLGNDTMVKRPRIDVMSIGSQQRPEYMQTQAQTWAAHATIRYFWNVTEHDDQEWANCSTTMNISQVREYVSTCRQKHSSGFLQQYRFFPARWVLRKSNPVGWLCAQVRVGTALAKMAQFYLHTTKEKGTDANQINKSIDLPDFALLVDDDTMFQMSVIEEQLKMKNFSIDDPIVWAGCLNVLPRGHETDRFSPFGGAGTVWSRGALERLLQPIHCNGNDDGMMTIDESLFVQKVCGRIRENLILEQDLFQEGMYLFEFIKRIYYQYPNCFHSDWLLGHLVNYYFLSEPSLSDDAIEHPWWDMNGESRLLPLHNPDSVGVFYNKSLPEGKLCQATNQNQQTNETCNKDSLVCHYIDPTRMRQVSNEWQTN